MSAADGGGGGGGASSLVVDHATLTRVAEQLGQAGSSFDSVGTSRPGAGGTGQAEPLLLMILAAASDAAARLAFESTTIAAAVEDCNSTVATVDAHEAASFLINGMDADG
jgi:hypothetical protein